MYYIHSYIQAIPTCRVHWLDNSKFKQQLKKITCLSIDGNTSKFTNKSCCEWWLLSYTLYLLLLLQGTMFLWKNVARDTQHWSSHICSSRNFRLFHFYPYLDQIHFQLLLIICYPQFLQWVFTICFLATGHHSILWLWIAKFNPMAAQRNGHGHSVLVSIVVIGCW